MANRATFEEAFTFTFQAVIGPDATPVVPDSLTSARLYDDYPSEAQIADTGNTDPGDAIESVTSWSAGDDTGEQEVSFALISDPDPTDRDDYEVYYVVVSWKPDAGSANINTVSPLIVYRPTAIGTDFDVDEDDIYAIESKLDDFKTSAQINTAISTAERLVKQDLRGRGKDLARVDLASIKDLAIYKALFILCNSLSSDDGDSWWVKAGEHKETYSMLIESLPISYDIDKDGDIEPDETEKQVSFVLLGG